MAWFYERYKDEGYFNVVVSIYFYALTCFVLNFFCSIFFPIRLVCFQCVDDIVREQHDLFADFNLCFNKNLNEI